MKELEQVRGDMQWLAESAYQAAREAGAPDAYLAAMTDARQRVLGWLDGEAARIAAADQAGFQRAYDEALRNANELVAETLNEARTHSTLMSAPCPLCVYKDGVFIRACTPHEELRAAWVERDEARALNAELVAALREVTPELGFPKCDSRCSSNSHAFDEDNRCDCGLEEMRPAFERARVVLAKARGG